MKLWDQEMKRCRSFTLGSGSKIDVVKSVCRYKVIDCSTFVFH